ncbi:uncharacterized protein C8Q71DRAFT_723932 [Rhodofomes roseus]|uniref:Uncharacterized protein n=1 Tax=Rhodofomes roseus TaxID=34475 RepID=A0ABQ8KE99_9APHY|nr:uncharacterized protein C8Q71DRAFT_723932 [Rhodofomes roseus]KAH9836062.1 hypothetical protein C8Q71DRAFT_723932 [Rhodofomes roseus]
MYTSEYDYLFKLLLIGDSGVGKNIVLRTHWTQRNSNTATRNWRRPGGDIRSVPLATVRTLHPWHLSATALSSSPPLPATPSYAPMLSLPNIPLPASTHPPTPRHAAASALTHPATGDFCTPALAIDASLQCLGNKILLREQGWEWVTEGKYDEQGVEGLLPTCKHRRRVHRARTDKSKWERERANNGRGGHGRTRARGDEVEASVDDEWEQLTASVPQFGRPAEMRPALLMPDLVTERETGISATVTARHGPSPKSPKF